MKQAQLKLMPLLSLTSAVILSGCTLAASPGSRYTYTNTNTNTGATVTITSTRTSTNTNTSTTTQTNTNTNTGGTAAGLTEARLIKGSSVSGAQNATATITYNWVGVAQKKDFHIFVHFLNANDEMQPMGDDHEPPTPTSRWSGNVSYSRTISIPAGLPVGNYKIVAGLFDIDDWSIDARVKMKPGSGVKDMGNAEYFVGTLVVTKGQNLPEAPVVPKDVDGPASGTAGARAGDAITNSAGYADDYHPNGYRMTFHDEFNANTLNSGTWINSYAWGERTLWGNGEEECYLERNVGLGRGELVLTAKKESVICPKSNRVQPYTSGMINSMNSFSQAYGYFAIRAKLPKGKGLWPAFWLLPATGEWPPEIDIFEVLGDDTTKLHTTYHWNDAKGEHVMDSKEFKVPDLSADYHVYAVDWQPGSIKWYLDGKLVNSHTGSDVYNKPAYILANLAVGGYWPGSPDANTPFPSEMAVDYIRVYAK